MKILIVSILFVLLLNGSAAAQETDESKVVRTFEISLQKTSYVLLERITIHFKAVLPRTHLPPRFKDDSVLKIMVNGLPDHIGDLSPFTGAPPISGFRPRPAFLGPTTTYEYDFYVYRLEDRFPRPGNYRIQILLKKPDGPITSNIVEVEIVEPTGVDKEAFEFLSQFDEPSDFAWSYREKNGLDLLEKFVEKYGSSAYGDEAKYKLANRYFSLREYDKAKSLFESLASSGNPIIAASSKDQVRSVESNRKSDLKKKRDQLD